jgi:adenylate kinase
MSVRRYSAVLLLGMPGSGKGTQGDLLGKIPGIFHLSTGAIFRSLADDSDDGRLVSSCLQQGQLVPDELTIEIWNHWIAAHIETGEFRPDDQILLLDGIPRTVRQCGLLQENIDVLQVLHLHVADVEPIVQRLRHRALIEGRSDDADETVIRQRFDVYRRETAPILNFYPLSLVHEIDPMGTPAEVLKRILEQLIPVIAAARGSAPEFDGHEISPDDAEGK